MTTYISWLVLGSITGWSVLVIAYFAITLADYGARCFIERWEQIEKAKAEIGRLWDCEGCE